jgi:type VI secretion system protein ImpL
VSRVIGLPPRWDDDDQTRVLGAPGPGAASLSAREGASAASRGTARAARDPYFLRDLFAKVILPDAGIAHPTRHTARRRELRRVALQAAAILGLALLTTGLITSFVRNRNLLKRGTELAQAAALVTAPTHPGEIESKLRALEPMRQFLVDLDRKDARPPLSMSFGLYRGKSLNRRARAIYLHRLVDSLLGPSRRALESRLFSSFPASPEEYRSYYDDFRAYLMLIDPERGENPFLADHLGTLWSGGGLGAGTSEGLRELVKSHMASAWAHPADVTFQSARLPGRNAALLQHVSPYIREYWRPDNFYLAMVDEVSDAIPAFTLASVPGAEQVLTIDTNALAADPDAAFVAGAFTLKGWQEEMRRRIDQSEENIQGDWILKEAFQGQPLNLRPQLLELYRRDYARHWARFLSAIIVIPPDGVGVATTRVRELAERTSPLLRLTEGAAANLRLRTAGGDPAPPPEIASIEDDFAALHTLFVTRGEGEQAKRPIDVTLLQAAGLVEMLRQRQESGDVGASSVQYAKALLGGAPMEKNPIAEAVVFADRHGLELPAADPAATASVRSLMKRVPEAAWRGILADAQRMLDVAWGNDVWVPFHETLHGKFPFQSGGPDAPAAEFTRFFGPGGVFWNFFDADLAPFLDRDGNARILFGHGLSISPEASTAIRKATDFRRALFANETEAGKLGFTFRVKPSQTSKVSGKPPFVSATRLSVGETRVVYDMGASRETKVAWPGAQAMESASLSVTMGGNEPGSLQFEGPWAFFRLLEKGTLANRSDTDCDVRWRLERPGEYAIEVPYSIRASTVPHPFRSDFFAYDCPRQIGPTGGGMSVSAPSTGGIP